MSLSCDDKVSIFGPITIRSPKKSNNLILTLRNLTFFWHRDIPRHSSRQPNMRRSGLPVSISLTLLLATITSFHFKQTKSRISRHRSPKMYAYSVAQDGSFSRLQPRLHLDLHPDLDCSADTSRRERLLTCHQLPQPQPQP